MADRMRPLRAGTARAFRWVPRAAIFLIVSGFGLLGTSIGVEAPGIERIESGAVLSAAVLKRGRDGPVIMGSIATLFDTRGFVGPNRTDKRGRFHPVARSAEMERTFLELRVRLASLITKEKVPADSVQTAALRTADQVLAVANVDPPLQSAALAAIEKAARLGAESDLPQPRVLPTALAYARANEPATNFDRPSDKIASRELWCLTEAIYFEARGESYRGQIAVGQVVMNRVKSGIYPPTICGVVFQNQKKRNACQFSFACDGIPEKVDEPTAWNTADEIARKIVDGAVYLPEVANATHYHASYVKPDWAPRMRKMTSIGLHVFYRFRGTKAG